jgi:hypothetical protein
MCRSLADRLFSALVGGTAAVAMLLPVVQPSSSSSFHSRAASPLSSRHRAGRFTGIAR